MIGWERGGAVPFPLASRGKAASGQMTSFQPAFCVRASLLATKHITGSLTEQSRKEQLHNCRPHLHTLEENLCWSVFVMSWLSVVKASLGCGSNIFLHIEILLSHNCHCLKCSIGFVFIIQKCPVALRRDALQVFIDNRKTFYFLLLLF